MKKNYIRYHNINYIMPFLFCNDIFIPLLKQLLLNEINPVTCVYGVVRSMWSGGRISLLNIPNPVKIDTYLGNIKKYNIIPAFTFSNPYIDKEMLNDKFCNMLLDIAYNHGCHFIVSSDILYNYIKDKYNDAHFVCSIVKAHAKLLENNFVFDETKFYNEMLDKHDLVVVRPEWIIENIDNIDKLISDISRIEVLVNHQCQYGCKNPMMHYKADHEFDLRKIDIKEYEKIMRSICPLYNVEHHNACFSDEIMDKLVQIGVKHFKMRGRTVPYDRLFDDLYDYFFNKDIPKEEIRKDTDNICAKLIQNNKMAQLNVV